MPSRISEADTAMRTLANTQARPRWLLTFALFLTLTLFGEASVSFADVVVVDLYVEADVPNIALKNLDATEGDLSILVKNFVWDMSDDLNLLIAAGATYGEEYFRVDSIDVAVFQTSLNRVRVRQLRQIFGQYSKIGDEIRSSSASHAIVVTLYSTGGKFWDLSWVLLDLRRDEIGYAGNKRRERIKNFEELEALLDEGTKNISIHFAQTFSEYFRAGTSEKIIVASCFWHTKNEIVTGDERKERLDTLQHLMPAHLAKTLNDILVKYPSLENYSAKFMPFTAECSKATRRRDLVENNTAAFLIHGYMDMEKATNQLTIILQIAPFGLDALSTPPWKHYGPNEAKAVADAMAPEITKSLIDYLVE